jgi:hypothetical protein
LVYSRLQLAEPGPGYIHFPKEPAFASGHDRQTLQNRPMNTRRVHELMREHFPNVDSAACNWVVAVDEGGLRSVVLKELLAVHVPGSDLLVEVHRKIGSFLPRQDVEAFVAKHLGQGDIRIADREFNGFVVVAASGVATGWSEPIRSA